MTLRPHDLVRLADPAVLVGDAPGWVPAALAWTPWVVVRRSTPPTGCVSVGVRGDRRAQRHPLTVPESSVREVVAPEDVAHRDLTGCRGLPALSALAEVRAHLDACVMPWGPTGSVGFELATGAATVGPDSDLDLVVRAPLLTEAVHRRLTELHSRLQRLKVRVDCQVETARGAVALAEIAASGSEVLVKRGTGAALVPIGELLA